MIAALLERVRMDGVILALTPSGTITTTGDREAVDRWLPTIREHKAALVGFLSAPTPITPEVETILRNWLDRIDERNPEMIADFFEQCRNETDVTP